MWCVLLHLLLLGWGDDFVLPHSPSFREAIRERTNEPSIRKATTTTTTAEMMMALQCDVQGGAQ